MDEHRHRTRQLLTRYLRPQAGRVAALAAGLGGSIALPLITPQIVKEFIDGALSGAALRRLTVLAALYLGVALAIQGLNLAVGYLSEQVGWTATNLLRGDLTEHALSLDMPYHSAHTPGEMIERIDGDVTALSNFFSQFVINVVWSALLLVGAVVAVWLQDPAIGAGLAVFAVVALAVLTRARHAAVPLATEQREQAAGLFGMLEERLSGLDDIRSSAAGGWVMRRFHETARDYHRASLRAEVRGAVLWCATSGLFGLGQGLMLGAGAWQLLHGRLTIGAVYLLYQYTQMLQDPIETIGEQLRQFQKAAAGAHRVADLMRRRPGIKDGPGAAVPDGPLSVRFDAVTFGYGEDEPVLRDVSFELRPGEVLGVLGRTGSGKTTSAQLLLRLYDVRSGSVSVGGVDVRTPSIEHLRARVGYVTQDVQLFGATVRDNVTLFDRAVPDATIVDVLQRVGLGEWYATLPEELDTHLAAGGAGMSAGEAQLLALARVFLRSPGLVILDEASSRLDPATEAAIEAAIDCLLAGRTGILIAHRLRTVARADRILVLEDGAIAEQGPRTELASDPSSRYAGLLRASLEEVRA